MEGWEGLEWNKKKKKQMPSNQVSIKVGKKVNSAAKLPSAVWMEKEDVKVGRQVTKRKDGKKSKNYMRRVLQKETRKKKVLGKGERK